MRIAAEEQQQELLEEENHRRKVEDMYQKLNAEIDKLIWTRKQAGLGIVDGASQRAPTPRGPSFKAFMDEFYPTPTRVQTLRRIYKQRAEPSWEGMKPVDDVRDAKVWLKMY